MSMQSYPAVGYMVEITKENVAKLDKLSPESSKRLFEMIDDGESYWEIEEDEEVKAFLSAFADAYGLAPDISYLSDEAEGCTGVAEPGKYFFRFDTTDKYVQSIRPEWKTLPFEPEPSSWTEYL